MKRILLVSGKGGTGKTTVATATALAAARRGHRTVALSFDLAHSLSDSFNLDRALFDQQQGQAVTVAENLAIQEIDVQAELEREWNEILRYIAAMFTSQGMSNVVAEEMAILPGMHDVIALLHINQYFREDLYDLIVVDCPPTTESLQFVSITSIINWYIRKRFNLDRQIVKLAGPIIGRLSQTPVPQDSYFASIQELFTQIEGIDETLRNPEVTTVRLVTNPEKMVIRETQRAYMYFSMYGISTDAVIVNRVLPAEDAYFAEWAQTQRGYVDEIREHFTGVPVLTVPWFGHEVIGPDRLQPVVEAVYGDRDPAEVYVNAPPYQFVQTKEGYEMRLRLPFVEKRDIDISRVHGEVIVRVGSFKQYLPLPRTLARLAVAGAQFEGQQLVIRFSDRKTAPIGA